MTKALIFLIIGLILVIGGMWLYMQKILKDRLQKEIDKVTREKEGWKKKAEKHEGNVAELAEKREKEHEENINRTDPDEIDDRWGTNP